MIKLGAEEKGKTEKSNKSRENTEKSEDIKHTGK